MFVYDFDYFVDIFSMDDWFVLFDFVLQYVNVFGYYIVGFLFIGFVVFVNFKCNIDIWMFVIVDYGVNGCVFIVVKVLFRCEYNFLFVIVVQCICVVGDQVLMKYVNVFN